MTTMTIAPGITRKRHAVRVTAALATATAAFGIIMFGFTSGSTSAQADDPSKCSVLEKDRHKCHDY